MEVRGKVKLVGLEQAVSPVFTKRELVVTTDEQYPQHILINFVQGTCNNILDHLVTGTDVNVSINLRGREWINPKGEAKYFNDIQGWNISTITGAPSQTTQQTAQPVAAQPVLPSNQSTTSDDEIF